MRPSVIFPIRPSLRLAVVGALALSASACSQTDRFAYDPFSNPFNGKETTGSVGSAPTSGVTSQPLPPPGGYQTGSYQPSNYPTSAPAYAPQQAQAYPAYQAPYRAQTARPPQPAPQYKYTPQACWSAQGGQTIVVKAGDTPYGLGARYGVPSSAILQANNLPSGAQLTTGQRIVIPSYNGKAVAAKPQPPASAPARVAEAPRATPARSASGNSHTVTPGETLFSIARTYNVTATELAQANRVGLDYHVRMGEQISIPGEARMQPATLTSRDEQPKLVQPVYRADEQAAAPVQPPRHDAEPAEQAAPQSASGSTDFRWPVRGRVISGFGAKPNGQTNDGVNISVPEGTEIKAAEGGVVAYAGNELKGFGNLILIRHAGEWVTAYAHASEILVKRGDVVRRGQLIARSGKTGNVAAPQLHFEVRRGASPVDPMNFLPQG